MTPRDFIAGIREALDPNVGIPVYWPTPSTQSSFQKKIDSNLKRCRFCTTVKLNRSRVFIFAKFVKKGSSSTFQFLL